MPGLGRRTFAPGEVLTATNVMGYLQDQAVMTFAGTAARGSAIGTAVSEGMVSYLADANQVQVYDGSLWRGVSGLTPITPTSVTVGSGSASISGNTITFTGATSITISGIGISPYKHYKIVLDVPTVNGAADICLRVGSTSVSSGYYYGGIEVIHNGGTNYPYGANTGSIPLGYHSNTAGTRLNTDTNIYNLTTVGRTQVTSNGAGATSGDLFCSRFISGTQINATAYTDIVLIGKADATVQMTGTVQIFGFN